MRTKLRLPGEGPKRSFPSRISPAVAGRFGLTRASIHEWHKMRRLQRALRNSDDRYRGMRQPTCEHESQGERCALTASFDVKPTSPVTDFNGCMRRMAFAAVAGNGLAALNNRWVLRFGQEHRVRLLAKSIAVVDSEVFPPTRKTDLPGLSCGLAEIKVWHCFPGCHWKQSSPLGEYRKSRKTKFYRWRFLGSLPNLLVLNDWCRRRDSNPHTLASTWT